VIRIHAAVFLALLELLLIAIGVAVFMFLRQRRVHRAPPPAQSEPTARQTPAAGHYLLAEANHTRARIDLLTSETNLDDRDEEAVAVLALRLDYLQVEHELAAIAQRDDAFWRSFDRRARDLRARHTAVPAQQAPTANELQSVPERLDSSTAQDAAKLQDLIQMQDGTIRNLKRRLDDAIGDDLTRQELHQEIDHLAHANREMSGCIKILEDESEFLRNQISALVK
jgi:hypothetical protein